MAGSATGYREGFQDGRLIENFLAPTLEIDIRHRPGNCDGDIEPFLAIQATGPEYARSIALLSLRLQFGQGCFKDGNLGGRVEGAQLPTL